MKRSWRWIGWLVGLGFYSSTNICIRSSSISSMQARQAEVLIFYFSFTLGADVLVLEWFHYNLFISDLKVGVRWSDECGKRVLVSAGTIFFYIDVRICMEGC